MQYQIGGSLRSDDPTYVVRQADGQLYHALKTGEFCYVLNSRQMGKSSLLRRTSNRLQKEGCACVYLDITQVGSEAVTPTQWYRGIITILYYSLNLTRYVNLKYWWEQHLNLSPVQQLHQFIEEVVLPYVQNKHIFIFIDEIDSLLALSFPVSDFFAWIRYCYQQRACNPEFNRLGFALFGVATPTDLIADSRQTPFNIGKAIELRGFQLHEATPLLRRLEQHISRPEAIFRAILYRTQGQPFLTQKLCQLILQATWEATPENLSPAPGAEALWVEQVVQSRVIHYWELQDQPEHLRTIRDRLLFNKQNAIRLLRLYQQVLEAEYFPSFRAIPLDGSPEQAELLLIGLVTKHCDYLRVTNPIYRSVFNAGWVRKQCNNLQFQDVNNWHSQVG